MDTCEDPDDYEMAKQPKPIAPSAKTLKRYGLSLGTWWAMAFRQKYVCAICTTLPKSGRLNVDHRHVKGWKNMEPSERVKYVSGLLCYYCNRQLFRNGWTVYRLRNALNYLVAWENTLG